MKPAAAAPSAARTNNAPELTRTCSLSIINRTAPANAPPAPSVMSDPPGSSPVAGSAAEAYLSRIGANPVTFKSEVEELQSLNQGRVKYVVEDDVIFTVFDKENPNHRIQALWDIATPDDIIFGGGYGGARFGFRKEDCMLRTAYSVALAELRNNGTVSAILKKYGLSDRNLVWFKLNP